MEEMRKNIISENRKKYSRLFQDYQQMYSFKNRIKRIGKNKYKRSIQVLIGILIFDLITYPISLFCFFNVSSTASILYWGALVFVNIFILGENSGKLKNYQNEAIEIRVDELCELLSKNNVNSQNIADAIEYFKLNLEPINEIYKEYTLLNSISSFWSNLFFLILGIIISSLIEKNLNQSGAQIYEIALAVLVFSLFVIIVIKVYVHMNRKDEYADQTRKLIIELKKIELLNRSK